MSWLNLDELRAMTRLAPAPDSELAVTRRWLELALEELVAGRHSKAELDQLKAVAAVTDSILAGARI